MIMGACAHGTRKQEIHRIEPGTSTFSAID